MEYVDAAEIRTRVERILSKVQKPSRYVGNEWNSIHKDWGQARARMAFAFPDVYEIGMSHLGTRILYHIVNSFPEFLCERVFAPWVDMEKQLGEAKVPLYALESFHPLRDFDVVGFTLQYEMSFTNILNMLKLAGIPLRSAERGPEDPWIIAGGPCVYNPEPLAPFIDFFLLGESETQLPQLLQLIAEQKKNPLSRQDFLLQAAQVQGVYVPEYYHIEYEKDGHITKIQAEEQVPEKVEKALVTDLDRVPYPTSPVVPYMEIVHDRMMLEVMRGCTRGCRFCQAGMIYRPVRERSPEVLLEQTAKMARSTGYQEVSLTSLSTGDYSCIRPVVQGIIRNHAKEGINVSLPSLRIDSFDVELANEVQKVRKSGLTFAPEAGTQRLRDIINKNVTEEDLIGAVEAAFRAGWSNIKLYFMIGLPGETRDDLDGIADLAKKVVYAGTKLGRRNVNVSVSVSSFVPKSHTPFQWEAQESMRSLEEKQKYLREILRDRRIRYHYHDVRTSFLEAVFAKGDRKLAEVLQHAYELGCRFDGWSEQFRYDRWMQAFEETGIDPHDYANRAIDPEEILPWEHLQSGVSKRFLLEEHDRALREIRTPDCRYHDCTGCGVCAQLGVDIDVKG